MNKVDTINYIMENITDNNILGYVRMALEKQDEEWFEGMVEE